MRTIAAVLVCLVLSVISTAVPVQAQISEDALRSLIEAAVRQYLDPSSQLEVSITGVSEGPEGLLIGDLTVNAAPAVLRGVRAEIFLQMSNLQLDPGIVASGVVAPQLKIRRVGRVLLVASTTAQALQSAVAERLPFVENPTISFNAGQFIVTGRLKASPQTRGLPASIIGQPASLRGRLVVERGEMIRILVLEATVGGNAGPVELVQNQLARINPILDLTRSPIPLRVKVLALHNDRLEMLAGTD